MDAIPEEGIVQIGNDNAKNTIIEFMDYFCGYCKKVHVELLQIAQERTDTRIIFLQHPILSESSKLLANMVVHTGSPCYRYCTCHFYSNDDKISYYKSIRADS